MHGGKYQIISDRRRYAVYIHDDLTLRTEKGMMKQDARQTAVEIVRHLRKNGFEAYFVGGAVRDMILGATTEDYDIATDASPDDIERLFNRVIPVGRQFGVSLVILDGRSYEIARFRTDGAYLDGRRPSTVTSSDIENDLRRRDFTINAMAYDPLEDRLIDVAGGREDISKRLIRTVGDPDERFAEDRLRILRAVRFAARFDYEIERGTFDALIRSAPYIGEVSAERIGEELARMFSGPHAEKALSLLDKTGLLEIVLPEVAAMKGVKQPLEYHPEGDVFEHTRRMLELFEGGSTTLAFGILLHDAGKPETYTVTDRIRFNRHDEVGASIVDRVLARLRFSRDIVTRVHTLVRNHMRFMHVREMRQAVLRRFMAMDGFEELLELFRLDCLASHGSLDLYDFVVSKREISGPELPEPLLGGEDLIDAGYDPGPLFSTILKMVADAQLEGSVTTRREALDLVLRAFPRDRRERPHRTSGNNPPD